MTVLHFRQFIKTTGWQGLRALLLCISIAITCPLWAQSDSSNTNVKKRGGAITSKDTTLTLRSDSTAVMVQTDTSILPEAKKDFFIQRFFRKNYPNPRKAALMSLIIPGSGQAYNKRWWKLPIVYGALGGLTWLEVHNVNDYKYLKSNYAALVDEDPATVVDARLAGRDRVTLKSARDSTRKTLEQSSLLLGLGYLLAVSDAFVDAHLSTFDVSDDLSMKICPKSVPVPGIGPSFGLAFVFALK